VVPAAVLVDLNVGYQFGRLGLEAGGNNIFDKYPPVQDPANGYFGIFKYSRVTPYGVRGAYFYTSAKLTL
jgi:outer membrane receptor protein involved in Fe transport